MQSVGVLTFLPLAGALLYAAWEDVRTRRIPNWLTFGLLLTGLARSFGPAASATPGQAFAGFALGFAITFLPFALGALGGGDVKLIAACGAWMGPNMTIELLVIVSIAAAAAAVVQAIMQRRTKAVLGSTAVVALGLLHARELGATHAADTARTGHGVDRPLPYAVPVLVGFCLVMLRASY